MVVARAKVNNLADINTFPLMGVWRVRIIDNGIGYIRVQHHQCGPSSKSITSSITIHPAS